MNIFSYYKSKGFFWFRIFGAGLYFKNIKLNPLLFGERYKYRKGILINKFYIGILKKTKT